MFPGGQELILGYLQLVLWFLDVVFPCLAGLVPGCLDSLLSSIDLVAWLPGGGSWFLKFTFWFHGLGSLVKVTGYLDSVPFSYTCSVVAWRRFLVAWSWFPGSWAWLPGWHGGVSLLPCSWYLVAWRWSLAAWFNIWVAWSWFPVPWSWFPGHHCLPGVAAIDHSWAGTVATVQLCMMNDDARIHFLVSSTWCHGCLVKVYGCQDSLSGSLNLVPWLPGEDSRLPRFSSCFPGLRSMVAWWRFLVAWIRFLVLWTWFHHCPVKFPGCLVSLPGSPEFVLVCLDSILASLDLVPRLPGEGSWLTGFTLMVPLTWFHDCLV